MFLLLNTVFCLPIPVRLPPGHFPGVKPEVVGLFGRPVLHPLLAAVAVEVVVVVVVEAAAVVVVVIVVVAGAEEEAEVEALFK